MNFMLAIYYIALHAIYQDIKYKYLNLNYRYPLQRLMAGSPVA